MFPEVVTRYPSVTKIRPRLTAIVSCILTLFYLAILLRETENKKLFQDDYILIKKYPKQRAISMDKTLRTNL